MLKIENFEGMENFFSDEIQNESFEEFVKHSGVKDMKWGVRIWQYPDGSLTPAGKARRAAERTGQYFDERKARKAEAERVKKVKEIDEKYSGKKKIPPKQMRYLTDDELKARTERLKAEKAYYDLVDEIKKKTASQSKGDAYSTSKDITKKLLTAAAQLAIDEGLNKMGAYKIEQYFSKKDKDYAAFLKKQGGNNNNNKGNNNKGNNNKGNNNQGNNGQSEIHIHLNEDIRKGK